MRPISPLTTHILYESRLRLLDVVAFARTALVRTEMRCQSLELRLACYLSSRAQFDTSSLAWTARVSSNQKLLAGSGDSVDWIRYEHRGFENSAKTAPAPETSFA